jgi:hypothetical protein
MFQVIIITTQKVFSDAIDMIQTKKYKLILNTRRHLSLRYRRSSFSYVNDFTSLSSLWQPSENAIYQTCKPPALVSLGPTHSGQRSLGSTNSGQKFSDHFISNHFNFGKTKKVTVRSSMFHCGLELQTLTLDHTNSARMR